MGVAFAIAVIAAIAIVAYFALYGGGGSGGGGGGYFVFAVSADAMRRTLARVRRH
jgi:hypothetical protein